MGMGMGGGRHRAAMSTLRLLGEMPSGVGEGQSRMERGRVGAREVEEEVETAAVQLRRYQGDVAAGANGRLRAAALTNTGIMPWHWHTRTDGG